MTFQWIDERLLAELEGAAAASPRQRQHYNLHSDYRDPAQRLLNLVGVDSYIRPHKHASASCEETLVAIRGLFGFITFDDEGLIDEAGLFGSERYAALGKGRLAVVVQPNVWHSVLALTPSAVLLECKAGPFDPLTAKDLAPWAPAEGTSAAMEYLNMLRNRVEAVRRISEA